MPASEGLCAEVRRHCAAVATSARWVSIDLRGYALSDGITGLDPSLHLLDASQEDVARYVLILDTVNFGSGWFPTLRGYGDVSMTGVIARRLTEDARGRGAPWTAEELRGLDPASVAAVLGQDPSHELIRLYTTALNHLGEWLGNRTALEVMAEADRSAERFARSLARGMPFFDDRGFYKRAQITANDLALAGVAEFDDLDHLTVFADNLVPHVLRLDGVLRYAPELAKLVDSGTELAAGSPMEQEIRACTVHACEQLAGRLHVDERTLDNWLWNRGNSPAYRRQRAHLTRTVFY